MHADELLGLMRPLPGTTEDFPFDEHSLVLRVGGKIYAIVALDAIPLRVNLKCDPERAMELREAHRTITPGYHMNKRHWNTLVLDGSLPLSLVEELVSHSYSLVLASLPARVRRELAPNVP